MADTVNITSTDPTYLNNLLTANTANLQAAYTAFNAAQTTLVACQANIEIFQQNDTTIRNLIAQTTPAVTNVIGDGYTDLSTVTNTSAT